MAFQIYRKMAKIFFKNYLKASDIKGINLGHEAICDTIYTCF